MPAVELRGVSLRYGTGGVWVLQGLSLSLAEGEGIIIRGRSGSGKTTLLNLIAGLQSPTKGAVLFRGTDINAISDTERAAFRNRHIGYCFQGFYVQKHLTVLENLVLPLLFRGTPMREAQIRGEAMLERLGLKDLRDEFPQSLSGGEGQRLALGRALIGDPDIVLADEPTGNLDEKTAEKMLNLLIEYHRSKNATLILVTHDPLEFQHHLREYLLAGSNLTTL